MWLTLYHLVSLWSLRNLRTSLIMEEMSQTGDDSIFACSTRYITSSILSDMTAEGKDDVFLILSSAVLLSNVTLPILNVVQSDNYNRSNK